MTIKREPRPLLDSIRSITAQVQRKQLAERQAARVQQLTAEALLRTEALERADREFTVYLEKLYSAARGGKNSVTFDVRTLPYDPKKEPSAKDLAFIQALAERFRSEGFSAKIGAVATYEWKPCDLTVSWAT